MHTVNVLSGLPPYGPYAVQFSANGAGTHREGYVVEFQADGKSWVGNFQPGLGGICTVIPHIFADRFIVISSGQAYEINPEEKSCTTVYGGDIQAYLLNEERTMLALITSTKIIFIDDQNSVLSSDRVSLDGIINPKFEDNCLAGEAYDPMCDCYVPFTVDVKTGAVQGGSFNFKPFTL